MRSIEFFTTIVPYHGYATAHRGEVTEAARKAEDDGWAGVAFGDSQNLAGDPYVAMAAAALTTSTIRLVTGVTNPSTRHAAVTANLISSIDVESGGRAELGIGRGDSALAHLGLAPAPPDVLASYVSQVRRYLRGEHVSIEEVSASFSHRLGSGLPLHDAPDTSRLEWLVQGFPDKLPVPVFVTASGPRVIELAAELADRVTLAVGAESERVKWAIGVARTTNPNVQIGAYVNVIVADDVESAVALGSGPIATLARFSAMHGRVAGPVTTATREALERIPDHYEMTRHGRARNEAAEFVTPLAEQFAIVGPGGYCRERLTGLAELGIDRFHIVGVGRGDDSAEAAEAKARFVDDIVRPGIRVA